MYYIARRLRGNTINANPFHHSSPQAGTRNIRDQSKDQCLSKELCSSNYIYNYVQLWICRLTLSISYICSYCVRAWLLLRFGFPSFPLNLIPYSRDSLQIEALRYPAAVHLFGIQPSSEFFMYSYKLILWLQSLFMFVMQNLGVENIEARKYFG